MIRPTHLLLRRLAALLAAVALLAESGGHWVLLQSVAWVGMVASYAQDRPLAEALSDTLDGQHPCELCQAVAEGRKQERRGDESPGQLPGGGKILKKLTARLGDDAVGLPMAPPASFLLPRARAEGAASRLEAPPTPPPRRV